MRVLLQGVDEHDVLFNVDGKGVVVNARTLAASVVPLEETAVSRFWVAPERNDPVSTWTELARCAIPASTSDVSVTAAGGGSRAYTIPKNVSNTASKARERRRFGTKGGTAVSFRVAALLAAGGQVELKDVAYVARFFSRNENRRGSQTWDLWGGDSGFRWAHSTMGKVALTAGADLEVNLLSFYEGEDDERTFFAQKDAEDPRNDEVSALFRRTGEASWQVWFNGDWENAPAPDVDENRLIELDDDTAVYVAGALFDAPDAPVSLRDFNPVEWDMAAGAIDGLDTAAIDRTLTSPVLAAARAFADASPGVYDKKERSKNASGQLRDANGRFAKVGDTGKMKGGLRGEIVSVNPVDGSLILKGEDGNTYAVPSKDFEIDNGGMADGTTQKPTVDQPGEGGPEQPAPSKFPPLNLDAILGQPRATATTPKAWLKKLLQPMGAGQLKKVVNDYGQFIKDERLARGGDFKGGTGWKEKGDPYHSKVLEWSRKLRRQQEKREHKHGRKREDGWITENALANDVPPVEKLTPETTDVAPLYLAIVDRKDPQAVTDLVAMIPATTGDSETTCFRRVAGDWVEDVAVLQDMRSPTPPPVVQLDPAMYADVLKQVDSAPAEDPNAPPPVADEAPPAAPGAPVAASVTWKPRVIPAWGPNSQMLALVTAAGGPDQNRGNAETLRRYWLHGPGAAKIRWGTGGDWKRCVRLLSKHLGPRAKGYCALRHKEATGMWTGDRKHRQLYGSFPGARIFETTEDIRPIREVIRASIDDARVRSLKARVYGQGYPGALTPEEISPSSGGRRFTIPLLIPEGLESGDGRTFDVGALSMRSLPLPLLWQTQTGEGHDGSVLVGRIDRVERIKGGLGNAVGVFDTGPYGAEAQRLVGDKMLRWVSVDLDRFEAEEVPDEAELSEGVPDVENIKQPKVRIKKGRLMGATLVSKPAFQEVTIELVPEDEMVTVEDGTYMSDAEQVAVVASGGIAAAIPVEPPRTWFNRPVLNGPTPIQVTNEGQVFGHIATWETSHIGLPGSTRAPRSASGYAYFHTGVLRTQDGSDVQVGQLTLAGGHAPMYADAMTAVKHYDDTGSAVCDVHAGEDAYGIWVAGALRPGTTPEQVRALRASAPSGDWRSINNRLELVAICQVNVPGFPVPRSQVASGAVMSLVAAGAQTLARMQTTHPLSLDERIQRLERFERSQERVRAEAAIARMKPLRDERAKAKEEMANLAASARARVFKVLDVDGYLTEFKDFSSEKRETLAKEGKALKDGSFPIENASDLRRAIQAYGRAEASKKAKVRRHIVKRARTLDKTEMVPSSWPETSINDDGLRARDAREVLTAAALHRRASVAQTMLAARQGELAQARADAVRRVREGGATT